MTLDMTFEHRMEVTRREALEEGKAEGKAEGIAQGKAEERSECIRNMLNSGKTPEQISEFCGYPIQEVMEVKSKI